MNPNQICPYCGDNKKYSARDSFPEDSISYCPKCGGWAITRHHKKTSFWIKMTKSEICNILSDLDDGGERVLREWEETLVTNPELDPMDD